MVDLKNILITSFHVQGTTPNCAKGCRKNNLKKQDTIIGETMSSIKHLATKFHLMFFVLKKPLLLIKISIVSFQLPRVFISVKHRRTKKVVKKAGKLLIWFWFFTMWFISNYFRCTSSQKRMSFHKQSNLLKQKVLRESNNLVS